MPFKRVTPFLPTTCLYFKLTTSGLGYTDFQPTEASSLSYAIGLAVQSNKNWLVDSRYSLLTDLNLSEMDLPQDRVTIFKLRAPDWDLANSKGVLSNLRDIDAQHGGLYYIGQNLLNLLKYQDKGLNIVSHFEGPTRNKSLWHYSDKICCTKRFPYPIRILSAIDFEPEHLALSLRDKMSSLYNGSADIQVIRTNLPIFDSHKKVVLDLPMQQPVLFLDSDFLPNENFLTSVQEVYLEEEKYVHLWQVRSACNRNIYGHGGPKLLNKTAFDPQTTVPLDMTTSIGSGLTIHPECVGTHKYNWSAESTWRTAFREGYKLRRISLDKEIEETERYQANSRLMAWVEEDHSEPTPFMARSISGAKLGAIAAETGFWPYAINDYQHLKSLYKKMNKEVETLTQY